MIDIYVKFNNLTYKLVFTNHAIQRMEQRGISIDYICDSIENYDIFFESYGKKVVEKNINLNIIRTVFDITQDNIILITSMFLGR